MSNKDQSKQLVKVNTPTITSGPKTTVSMDSMPIELLKLQTKKTKSK